MKNDSPSSGKSRLQALLEPLKCRLVRISGRSSNPRSTVEDLMGLLMEPEDRHKRLKIMKLLEPLDKSKLHDRKQPRLRQGVIQDAVFAVMAEAKKPLLVKEIHSLAEKRLKHSASYDTVCSFLTTSSKRHKAIGIHLLEKGKYLLIQQKL